MEHLLPDEIDKVLREFYRVAINGFLFSITYQKSKRWMNHRLHPTVRPEEWWIDKLSKYGEVTKWTTTQLSGVTGKPMSYLHVKIK